MSNLLQKTKNINPNGQLGDSKKEEWPSANQS